MALDTGSGVQTVPGGESIDESHAHITCTIEVSLLCWDLNEQVLLNHLQKYLETKGYDHDFENVF